MAAGGEVWFGDETTVREYPPLRAAWAKRGEPANVVISGRNSRRVLHGALNAATGELVQLIRERSRQDAKTIVSPSSRSWGSYGQRCPSCSSGIMRHRTIPYACARPPSAPTSRLPGSPSGRPSSTRVRTCGA